MIHRSPVALVWHDSCLSLEILYKRNVSCPSGICVHGTRPVLTKMASRDPASDQLVNYKKNLKVSSHITSKK